MNIPYLEMAFADMMELRSHKIKVGSDTVTGILRRKGKCGHRHMQREENQVKTGRDIEMLLLQVKDYQQPPGAGSCEEDFSPGTWGGEGSCANLYLRFLTSGSMREWILLS